MGNGDSPSNGSTYAFFNVNSGMVMEVANGSKDDGANVQHWEWNLLSGQQK